MRKIQYPTTIACTQADQAALLALPDHAHVLVIGEDGDATLWQKVDNVDQYFTNGSRELCAASLVDGVHNAVYSLQPVFDE